VFVSSNMSQYSKHFIDPIFKKDEQEALIKSGEVSKIAFMPIKAPRNNDTCSVFHDHRVSRMVNYIMKCGRKDIARQLMSECFERIKRIQLERYHKASSEEEKSQIILNPVDILHAAIENCRPVLMVTPIRRGGVKYQVPMPISEKSSYYRACKWLVEAAREHDKRVHLPEKMAYELLDAASNTGRVVKRKQDLHKLCEANRAYAHYRWS
jgi:small subunit ribosomal protein S7